MDAAALATWLQPIQNGDWLLTLYIQPGAKTTNSAGVFDGALKIRLQAQPIDGRANQALLAWLAQRLKLPRSALTLVSGDTQRRKRVQINGTTHLTADHIVTALTAC